LKNETKAAEKRRSPNNAKHQDFFGLRRFSAAFVSLHFESETEE
jgi:hypothetical protein